MSFLDRINPWTGRVVSLPKEERKAKPKPQRKPKKTSKKAKSKAQSKRSVPVSQTITLGGGDRGRRVRTEWDAKRAEREGYKCCTHVYIAVSRRAQACTEALPIIQERSSNGDWVKSERTSGVAAELRELIRRPSKEFSWSSIIERNAISLDLAGNFLTNKIDGLSRHAATGIAGLSPIPPSSQEPRANNTEGLVGYEILAGPSRGIIVDPSDVVHGQYAHLSNPYWGMSPLQAAAFAVDSDNIASEHNTATLKNGMYPSGMISTGANLKEKDLESARGRINQSYGRNGRPGEVLLMNGDAKFTQFGMSPERLMALDIRRFSREEIFATIGLPPVLGGDYERATYNNIQSALQIFWTLNVLPLLRLIYSAYERSFEVNYGEDFRIWYSIEHLEFLNTITLEQAQMFEIFARNGIPAPEINRRLGLGFDGDSLPSTPSIVAPTSESGRSTTPLTSPPTLRTLPGGKA